MDQRRHHCRPPLHLFIWSTGQINPLNLSSVFRLDITGHEILLPLFSKVANQIRSRNVSDVLMLLCHKLRVRGLFIDSGKWRQHSE